MLISSPMAERYLLSEVSARRLHVGQVAGEAVTTEAVGPVIFTLN